MTLSNYNFSVQELRFLSAAHEVGRKILSSPCLAVRLCIRVSFPDDISETVSLIAFILDIVRGPNHIIVQIVPQAPNLDHL